MAPSDSEFKRLRIVFAGTPDFAAAHLQALLHAGADIVAVYTQPDRPAGRGKKLSPSPVKTVAETAGLAVRQPAGLKDPAVQAEFAALEADIFVVVAYGLLIPAAILEMPRLGCINVHASLLPRWRGAAPIQRAIEAGDRESGVTIMQMDQGLDTGDMLARLRCDIGPDETGGTLHDKLETLGPPALIDTLSSLARGEARPEKQDDSLACYAPKITKAEAALDWRRPAAVLERRVRAFNPFPVCHTRLGERQIRIWAVRAIEGRSTETPGTVVAIDDGALTVACGEQLLAIEELQLPGKRRLQVAELLRGNPGLFELGHIFDGPAE